MLSPPNEGGLSHKAISLTKLLQLPCDFEDFFGFFSSSFSVYIYIGKYTYSSLVISSESIASMTILSYDMMYIYMIIFVYIWKCIFHVCSFWRILLHWMTVLVQQSSQTISSKNGLLSDERRGPSLSSQYDRPQCSRT